MGEGSFSVPGTSGGTVYNNPEGGADVTDHGGGYTTYHYIDQHKQQARSGAQPFDSAPQQKTTKSPEAGAPVQSGNTSPYLEQNFNDKSPESYAPSPVPYDTQKA